MKITSLLLAAASLCVLTLSACSTTGVSLDYQPGLVQTLPGPRVVAVGRFVDVRQQTAQYLGALNPATWHMDSGTLRPLVEPDYLGSVSPAGMPIDKLKTYIPVDQVVRNSFAYGLRTRHMLAPRREAPFVMTGEIINFYVSQVVHPYARCEIRVTVSKAPSGKVVYSRIWTSERKADAYMPWSGSPVPMLTELASRALQEVVDRTLDDMVLRANLQPGGA